jgi:hypothetical protein
LRSKHWIAADRSEEKTEIRSHSLSIHSLTPFRYSLLPPFHFEDTLRRTYCALSIPPSHVQRPHAQRRTSQHMGRPIGVRRKQKSPAPTLSFALVHSSMHACIHSPPPRLAERPFAASHIRAGHAPGWLSDLSLHLTFEPATRPAG